jgi:ankyrin repeat protein
MNGKTRKKNSGGGKTRKKNSRGRKTRSKRQRGENQEEKDNYLFDAIGIYDYDKVENALNNGANVNALNNDGDTPLIRAINSGEYDVIELLLENGADVTNEEQSLAEDLEEDDQDQSGIPYLIEYYIEIKKKKDDFLLKQNIVAQTIPKVLERQEDRKNLAMVMSEKDVGNVGDGTMPLELRHEIGKYLGGGKRKTRKKNSRGRKTRKKNSRGRKLL